MEERRCSTAQVSCSVFAYMLAATNNRHSCRPASLHTSWCVAQPMQPVVCIYSKPPHRHSDVCNLWLLPCRPIASPWQQKQDPAAEQPTGPPPLLQLLHASGCPCSAGMCRSCCCLDLLLVVVTWAAQRLLQCLVVMAALLVPLELLVPLLVLALQVLLLVLRMPRVLLVLPLQVLLLPAVLPGPC